MPDFTTNLGIEKPNNGQQVGTWGTTVNENMDIFDRVMSQVGSIALSSTSETLTTSEVGVISEGHYGTIKFTGSPGGTCTVTIVPSTVQRIYTIINATDQTVTMTQGSGGNVSITVGETKVIYCDGAGAGAEVVDVFASLDVGALSIGGTAVTANAADLNILAGGAAAGVSATEFQYLNGVTSAIQTQIDTKAPTASPTFTGTVVIPTADINGGTIDGTNVTVGSGKTLDVSGGTLTLADNQISGDKVEGGTIAATTITTLTSTTANITTVDLGDWTITESAGVLYFATGGTNKMKLTATGDLTVTGDITAFGTI